MITAPGVWEGGALSAPRLDRAELVRRLGDIPGWVLDPLADAFEARAAEVMAEKAEKDRKKKPRRTRPTPPESED